MIDVDLFAGAGGWDIAAHALGHQDVVGLELDAPACATRRAAWLNTIRADVSLADPRDYCPIRGLIASPPCQAFSNAGDGLGRAAIGAYIAAIGRMRDGEPLDRAELDTACQDTRAHLVLEPLRWALEARPEWVALEQVPPVLPIWEAIAAALRAIGYSAWCGKLSAEQYGVPQTRERAILIASRVRQVDRPRATHARYVAPRRCDETSMSLFDPPEAERIVLPEDRDLEPWVSMAEAIAWPAGLPLDHHRGAGMRERHGDRADRTTSQPAPTVTAGESRWSGGPRWTLRGPGAFNGTVRQLDEPAPTLTAHPGRHGVGWELRAGTGEKEASRPVDAPAPTIRFGARLNSVLWQPTHYDTRYGNDGRYDEHLSRRPVSDPAPTQTAAGLAKGRDVWITERPATTVCAEQRLPPPGRHEPDVSGSQMADAIRITETEAAILQSFPPDYPWQGTKTQRFRQIGNAMPPLLALAVLEAVA